MTSSDTYVDDEMIGSNLFLIYVEFNRENCHHDCT
jgi:hypothetical protein